MPNQQVRLGTIYLDFIARNARFVSQLQRNANAMRRQQRAIRALRRDILNFNRASRAMLASLISLRHGFAAILGIGGIFGLIRGFTQLSDIMQLATSRVKVIATDTMDFRAAMSGLFQIAQETRTPLDALVDLYARVGRAVQFLGFNHRQILPFIRSVAQAIVVSGATQQEARAGLIQFAQGLAVAALRGDEFRSVAEQLPRLMLAIADGINTTLGPLRRLALDYGALSPELVFNAIARSAPEIAREFEDIPRTVGQALTQVRNQLLFTVDRINLTAGSTSALANSFDRVRAVIADPSIIQNLINALSGLVNISVLLVENFERVGHVFQVLFVAAIARSGIGRFVVNLTTLVFTTGQWRAALASTAAVFRTVFATGVVGLFARRFRRLSRVARVAFGRIIRFTRSAATSLASYRVILAAAGRSMLTFRGISVGTGLALRTGFAASVAVATLALRGMIVALRALRAVGRGVAFIALIEGILALVRFIFILRRNVLELGVNFGTAARVAGIEFVFFLGRQLAKIPGLLVDVIVRAGRAALGAARRVATIIGQELNPFSRPSERFADISVSRPSAESIIQNLAGVTPEERAKALAAVRASGEEVIQEFLNIFGAGGGRVRESLNDVFTGTDGGVPGIINLEKAIREAQATAREDLVRIFRQVSRTIQAVQESSRARLRELDIRRRSIGLTDREAEVLRFRANQEESLNRILRDRETALAGAQRAVVAGRQQLEEARQTLASAGQDDPSALLTFAGAVRNLTAAETKVRTLTVALEGARNDLAQYYDEIERDSEILRARLDDLFRAEQIQSAIDLGTDAFEELATTAIFNFNRIGEAARRLGQQLIQDLIRVLFLRQISGALGRGLGNLIGINQAQHGGFHSGLTLVGERGPEVVDFRSPARVTPAEDVRAAAAAGGANGINIVYAPVIESDNEAAVEAGLARAFPVFEESIRNSIGADLGRPSVLRRQSRRR